MAGDRFHASEADAHYGSSGQRYPQHTPEQGMGDYAPGESATESGKIDGNWIMGTNDSHGTHVTGSVGANRDGSEFHGVAWGADVWVGNTGGTDDTNYGPFQDYEFFHSAWKALADNLIKENGAERGGVINNSFGTNTRVVNNGSYGSDGGNTGVHFPTDTVSQTEYEYFLFKQVYGDEPSFVDAAYKAVETTNVVQIFTTGNRDFANPFYRPLYPYFNPAAEKNWIAVAGLQKDGDGGYKLVSTWNEAGLAKYWTVVAPGSGIYGSKVNTTTGEATWGNSSGTSMAAPHVAGAMAVLMSRYQDMSAIQVRDVLFTTASHTNPDGTTYKDWTANEGEVDERYGWGTPDLEKGMYGLGQLLGHFDYNQNTMKLDVWSNDISQVALDQRKREDIAWKLAAEAWLALDASKKLSMEGLTEAQKELLGEILLDTDDDVVGLTDEQEKISEEDAIKWRTEYYNERLEAINGKLYDGSLTKSGSGTLVMTGNNTYKGTTTVAGGKLLAFAESIGEDNTVTVKDGGTFGVLSSYDDQFTMKGHLDSVEAEKGELKVDIKKGGTLYVDAASNVTIDSVSFEGTEKNIVVGLAGADRDSLISVYNGEQDVVSGSLTVNSGEAVFDGAQLQTEQTSSAFFEVGQATAEGNSVSVTMQKKDGVSFATFATNANEMAIAQALEGSHSAFAGDVLLMNADQIAATYDALNDDTYTIARNAFVVNATAVTRSVLDQARGMGEGRSAELDQGRGRIWASGLGLWGDADGSRTSMDVDFRAWLIGGEVVVHDTTKIGAFFGYGSTDYKGAMGKIDADDIHYGLYGISDIGPVSLTYGLAYTDEDRDTIHNFAGTANAHSEDASVLQGFAEAAYNFEVASAKISPYVGYTWARVKTDSVTEQALGHSFKLDEQKDDLHVATVGVRAAVPFTMGTMPVAVKANVGWSHFFGDTESVTNLQLGAGGNYAAIEGNELENQFNVGLGVVGQISKHATVGFSYTGSIGSDTDAHGIMGTVRINF